MNGMSDWDETELAGFRALIEQRLQELEIEEARGLDGQNVVVLDQQSVGRLSRMDALQSQAMAKGLHARRDALRKALVAARGRLDEGEYGYCDDCGDTIAEGRLRADPTAMKCVSCASG